MPRLSLFAYIQRKSQCPTFGVGEWAPGSHKTYMVTQAGRFEQVNKITVRQG
jgi:hypothetical protein